MDSTETSQLDLVRKLVRLMTRAELSEIEIEDQKAGLRVHLKRGAESAAVPPVVHVTQGAGVQAAAAVPQAAAAPAAVPEAAPGAATEEGVPFLSPMVGTFYRAASPDAEPFVDVGAEIEEDTVVCIVEAMKVMNEIKAETKGTIVKILVENGEPVEFGQPLFILR